MLQRGTFDYTASELMLGKRSTFAVDVYSFGVMLHEIITGEAPNRRAAPPRELRYVPDASCTLNQSNSVADPVLLCHCLAKRVAVMIKLKCGRGKKAETEGRKRWLKSWGGACKVPWTRQHHV